jgi:hypothetical protein
LKTQSLRPRPVEAESGKDRKRENKNADLIQRHDCSVSAGRNIPKTSSARMTQQAINPASGETNPQSAAMIASDAS